MAGTKLARMSRSKKISNHSLYCKSQKEDKHFVIVGFEEESGSLS